MVRRSAAGTIFSRSAQMVGGVETSSHTRPPSLNYAGSTVQPGVVTRNSLITHSLKVSPSCLLKCKFEASSHHITVLKPHHILQA